MEIKQLQAIATDCRNLLRTIHDASFNDFNAEAEQKQLTEDTIKNRRTQIHQLKNEIAQIQTELKKKKKLNKYIETIEREIRSLKSLTNKEKNHNSQLQQFCEKLRLKLSDQKTKVSNLIQQEQLLKEFEVYVDGCVRHEQSYNYLSHKYEQLTRILIQEKSKYEDDILSKRKWVNQISNNNASIDIKIKFLANQIGIQQEIIRELAQFQHQDGPTFNESYEDESAFDILTKQESAIFSKKDDLNAWQKHEIDHLLQKKIDQKQKQARRVGSIFRQRFTTHYKQTNNPLRKDFNFSADLYKLANKSSAKNMQNNNAFHFVSRDRIKELEKNKRIRTRYTQSEHPREKQQNLKTVIREEKVVTSEKPSIISIYQQFRKQRTEDTINFLRMQRKANRRKSSNKNKGIPPQRQHF